MSLRAIPGVAPASHSHFNCPVAATCTPPLPWASIFERPLASPVLRTSDLCSGSFSVVTHVSSNVSRSSVVSEIPALSSHPAIDPSIMFLIRLNVSVFNPIKPLTEQFVFWLPPLPCHPHCTVQEASTVQSLDKNPFDATLFMRHAWAKGPIATPLALSLNCANASQSSGTGAISCLTTLKASG